MQPFFMNCVGSLFLSSPVSSRGSLADRFSRSVCCFFTGSFGFCVSFAGFLDIPFVGFVFFCCLLVTAGCFSINCLSDSCFS